MHDVIAEAGQSAGGGAPAQATLGDQHPQALVGVGNPEEIHKAQRCDVVEKLVLVAQFFDELGMVGAPRVGEKVESLNLTFIGIGLLSLLFGIFFVIAGLLTFLRYRKENPLPEKEQA